MNKSVGLLRKLQNLLLPSSLISIYETFVRPHLYYGGNFYDQDFNYFFHQILEIKWFKTCIAVAESIKGNSSDKLYQKLGLESL